MKKFYVLGFLFSYDLKQVALIEKLRPDWQHGKVNGIGGKIELWDDSPLMAMVREFKEEAGVEINNWAEFCKLSHKEWEVYCFKALGDLTSVRTVGDEKIKIIPVENLSKEKILYNLNWIIPLALDLDSIKGDLIYD